MTLTPPRTPMGLPANQEARSLLSVDVAGATFGNHLEVSDLPGAITLRATLEKIAANQKPPGASVELKQAIPLVEKMASSARAAAARCEFDMDPVKAAAVRKFGASASDSEACHDLPYFDAVAAGLGRSGTQLARLSASPHLNAGFSRGH